MKKSVQSRKADYLLDELGYIDDVFLAETINWDKSAHAAPRKRSVRVLLAAASLVLVLAVGAAGLVTMLRRFANPEPNVGDGWSPGRDGDAQMQLEELDQLLRECVSGASFTRCTDDNLNFFDGTVRLVIEDRATEALFVSRPLNSSEQSAVSEDSRASGVLLSEDGAESAYRIWVTLGDGSVVSPCLTSSAGNIGAAVLFDYSSERIPTQDFTDLLSGMR